MFIKLNVYRYLCKRTLATNLNNLGTFDAKLVREHNKAKDASKSHFDDPTISRCNNGNFTMILPPPNVTGNLHIGHALTVAIEDSICRFQRLLGKKVFWIPGFDHAGIATQSIVEKHIYRQLGKKKEELTDQEFINHCEKWKEARIHDMTAQLNSLGCSLDWPLLFYTLDKNFTNAVAIAFCRLYEMGLIVREKHLVRSFGETEPTLREQWFLHLDQMKQDLLNHLYLENLNLDPPTIKGNFLEFLRVDEHWCLSRQQIWGHKIPAYFVESSQRPVSPILKQTLQPKSNGNEKPKKMFK